MSERDELAEIIAKHDDHWPDHVADLILAAGYRKPREVTTAAELDALPHGSALLTSDTADTVLLKDGEMFRNQSGYEITTEILFSYGGKPFTVLHEPEGER